ncbi:hypothetical protein PG2048B_0799 [Bifidobacterium pseudolongum subsp. globosum]|uniref:hypothetical protein n=1 Tax=Bifidobacterium pseudolongum TaxID=1694 RepID=UPI001021E9D1|nr:hypothetical protein [Bifidobacterium pseudolongum]RYQ24497.1 hypothetical protein PG2048B_0799 [Bifidobacterium pseudolongum subsp. globosum]
MADGFKAGTVYIAVEPETRGFYAKVKAMLERLDDQTIHLDTDVDTMDARRQIERLQRSGGTIDFDVRVNTRAFDRVHRELAEMTSMAQIDVKADTTRFDKGLADSFDKMRQNHANALKAMDTDAVREQRKQVAKLRELNAARDAVWFDKWNHMASYKDSLTAVRGEISRNIEAHKQLGNALDAAKLRRDSFKRNSDEYRAASAEVKRLRSEYTQLGNEIRRQEREAAKLSREHSKFMAKNAHELDKVNGKISEQRKLVKSTTKSVLAEVAAEDKLNNVFRTKDMLIDRNGLSYQRLERDLKRNADVFRKASEQVAGHIDRQRELSKSLLKTEGNVDGLRRSLSKLQFVDTKGHVKDLDAMTRRVDELQKALLKVRSNPSATIKFKAELDKNGLQAELERLSRDVEVEVRVNAQQAALERLERELFELEHKRVNIPVDLKVDYENAIAERKRLIEQIRRNPDMDWEVKSNVDIDEANARRKLRDLQNDYDKLDMDVDLETALARAHLAYFTRPRTVDIFAKFHGTDLGKILSGMTAGATGIKGVQNQFDRLVNLFDNFDTIIPKVSALGTAMAGIGAGAINLSGSVLGVGASIVSMSKAALAAPSALAGLGVAYASLRMIIGDKGKAWSENINLAGTALEGLGEKLQEAFYGKAAPAFKEFANAVGDVVGPQMRKLAELEADVFNGMLKMVTQSNKIGQLGSVFTDVNKSIENLVPGVESVVKSFLELSDSTSTYLPRAATYVSDLAEQFSRWVNNARLSGEINKSMAQVVEQAGYLKTAFQGVIDIASGLYRGLAEQQNGLEGFSTAVEHAADAVNSVRFQETLQAWAAGAADAKENMRGSFSAIGDAAYELRSTTADVFRNAGSTIGSFASNISRLLARSKTGISDFSSGVSSGFQTVFDALGDVAPMFSQLLTTAGQLSKTFGGTLASSLRAAAPLIQSMAKAAESVANAFAKLPEPVQAAIGLWATFGRAGMSAFNSLKVGILETTANMLQYRKMLNGLGLEAKGVGIGMKDALSGFASASPALSSVTGAVAQATGAFGKFKALAGGLFSAVNWPVAGVIAAVGAVGAALSDMSSKAASNQQIVDDIASAFGRLADEGYDASTSMNAVQQSLRDALNNPDLGERSWLDDVFNGVADTTEAMRTLGITTEQAIGVASGSTKEYQKEFDRLTDIITQGTQVQGMYGSTTSDTRVVMTDAAESAKKYRQSMEALRKKYIDAAEETAKANGYTEGYAKSLIEAGISSDQLAVKIATQEQRQKMVAQATRMHVDSLNDQRVAARNAMSAASNYQATLSGMQDTVARVKELTNDQNKVWDETSTLLPGVEGAFNTMSESGRLAQQSLETLGSSAYDVMEKMVESGSSAEQVTAATSRMRDEFIQTAIDMGVPQKAAEQLAQQYGLIPEQVDTLIKVHADEAKSTIALFVSNLRAAFPDDDGKTFDMVMNLVMNGDIKTIDEAYKKVQELRNNPDVNMLLSVTDDNASGKIDDIKSALKGLGIDWPANIDVRSEEGKAKLADIQNKLRELGMSDAQIKLICDTLTAEHGWLGLLDEINNSKAKQKVDADTDPAKAKMSAFINDNSAMKTIPADLSLDEAESKVNAFAAVAVKKPVQTEVEQPSIVSTIASIGSIIGSLFIPPAKVRVEGDDTDARTKIGAMQAFGGQTLASMLALILGDDTQARNAIGGVSAFNGVTIANPWARVLGENVLASLAINAIAAFGGRTISRPWTRVQGENTMARMAIMLIQAFNGRTVARPWARVDGDASGANAVISAIASTNGSVIATRYVDIVTRGSGEVHAATGGRIHGPGTGTSDSIPAMLSNNEHVIRAASVAKLDREVGPNFLNVLNRTGDISKALANANNRYLASAVDLARGAYATGGRVQKALSQDAMTVVIDGGRTVNQTFNVSTKIVRSDQDLHAAAQIDRAALMRTARREARL